MSCGGGGSDPPSAPSPATDFGATLVSHVQRNGVAGNWGYVAPDGGHYALMGTAKGVLVLDLQDPANPQVVTEVDGPTNTGTPGIYWREMRVYGSHAYIVSEHTNFRGGIMILDLSGLPAAVRYVKSVVPHDGELAAHTVDIDTARGLLYLQRETNLPAPQSATRRQAQSEKPAHPVGDVNDGSIEVWDLAADPENPSYVTTFNQHRSIHDMTAVGDFVYVAEGYASSYSIWTCATRRRRPASCAGRWRPATSRTTSGRVATAASSSRRGVAERFAGARLAAQRQRGADAAVVVQGRHRHAAQRGDGRPHGLREPLHRRRGRRRPEQPRAPKIVAQLDTNPYDGPQLQGCWGVYKFPNEPLMVCSDIDYGFNLIRLVP
jgi:hypothetical protein